MFVLFFSGHLGRAHFTVSTVSTDLSPVVAISDKARAASGNVANRVDIVWMLRKRKA